MLKLQPKTVLYKQSDLKFNLNRFTNNDRKYTSVNYTVFSEVSQIFKFYKKLF